MAKIDFASEKKKTLQNFSTIEYNIVHFGFSFLVNQKII